MTVPPPRPKSSAPRADRRRARRRTPVGRALWVLFLALELPLLVAVGAGLAAGFLHPGPFWWAQLCAAALPYLALVLAAAAAGAIVARRWGWLALHAALLALVGARTLPPGLLDGAPPPPRPDDLVLMTFNVPVYGPSAEALADSIAALVGDVEPDLLAMQEAWAREPRVLPHDWGPQVTAVLERLPYWLALPLPVPTGERMPGTNEPLLVRERVGPGGVDVVEQRVFALGAPGDPDASSGLRTRFRWRGREAVHYNVHLRSYGREKPWQDAAFDLTTPRTWLPYLRRYRDAIRARAAETERLVAALEAERLPVLLSGDVNEAPFSWTYWQLRRAGTDGAPRADAFRAAGRGDGRTYHARRPVVRIDYVLADRAFEVVRADVPAATFSDHRPLVVRLRWRD